MRQLVYVLTNKAMPGYIKIGKTTHDNVSERLKELNSTGVPFPFECAYVAEVEDCTKVEEHMHRTFHVFRENKKREFFKMDADTAIAELKTLEAPEELNFAERGRSIDLGSWVWVLGPDGEWGWVRGHDDDSGWARADQSRREDAGPDEARREARRAEIASILAAQEVNRRDRKDKADAHKALAKTNREKNEASMLLLKLEKMARKNHLKSWWSVFVALCSMESPRRPKHTARTSWAEARRFAFVNFCSGVNIPRPPFTEVSS